MINTYRVPPCDWKLKEENDEQCGSWKHDQKIVQQRGGIETEGVVGKNKWEKNKGKEAREIRTWEAVKGLGATWQKMIWDLLIQSALARLLMRS